MMLNNDTNDDFEIMMAYDENECNDNSGVVRSFTHINLTEHTHNDPEEVSNKNKKRRVDYKFNFQNDSYENIPNTFSTSVLFSNELSRTQTPQPIFNQNIFEQSISIEETMEEEYNEKIKSSLIYVKNLRGETSSFSFIGNDLSIRQLKYLIEEKWSLSFNQIRLMHGKNFVDDDDRVNSSSRLFMIAQVLIC
jgi:hypothetical protein